MNHADWILENYDKIKNPYAQCMLCLVLGFRGDLTCEEFLLEQISYFRKNYPEERFDQGPLIAVYLVNHQEKKLSLL